MLEENDLACSFELSSYSNENLKLEDINHEYMVLYFYPKDDTSGCTIEAKEFSSLSDEFNHLSTIIYGISKDDIKSHKKFAEKYDLKIDLISDTQDIAEKYGVWAEKSMYGKKYFGIERTTFLLDKAKRIIKIWKKVKSEGHALEVLNYVKLIREN